MKTQRKEEKKMKINRRNKKIDKIDIKMNNGLNIANSTLHIEK